METVHHLYIAMLKGYLTSAIYQAFCARYTECVKMLNGLERALEQQLPSQDRRFPSLNPEP